MAREKVGVLVLTPMPLELQALRAELGKPDSQGVEPKDHLFSYVVWRHVDLGAMPGSGSLVAVVPVEKDQLPAGDTVHRALAMWSPSCFALLGIAGQLSNKIKLGDVVVGRHVFQWDTKRKEGEFGATFSLTPAPSGRFGVNLAHLLTSELDRYKQWKESCTRDRPPELESTSPDLYTEDIASGSATIDSEEMSQMAFGT